MKHSSSDKPIPKEQLTAYERWELPLLDERGNEVVREEEREVKPLTAAEIGEIREAAREDGFNEGREQGFQAGLQEGREEGLKSGHEEGREQGLHNGLAEARQQVDAQMDRLEQLMGELLLPIQRHDREIESALLNLTVALARSVLMRELSTDTSHIQQVVRQALAALPSTADNLRIHVHSQDLEHVRQVAERLDASASVMEDDSVTPGGCRVETRQSQVDFTVEKRFQQTLQAMLAERSDGDSASVDHLNQMAGDLSNFRDSAPASSEPEYSAQSTSPDVHSDEGKGDDIITG